MDQPHQNHFSLSTILSNGCTKPSAKAADPHPRRYLLSRGISPGRIAIAGDSAGGGLVVAAMLAIRQAGLAQPACGWCISPWVDMEAIGETMSTKAEADPMVQRPGLLEMAGLYLGGADPRSPLAAPIYADLKGLAPLLIQVGAAETLLDDAIRLAKAAGAADVRVDLQIWPEMVHVWHLFHPELKAGLRAAAACRSPPRNRPRCQAALATSASRARSSKLRPLAA